MSKLAKIERLIALALDERGNLNERHIAALQAVTLIHKESILLVESAAAAHRATIKPEGWVDDSGFADRVTSNPEPHVRSRTRRPEREVQSEPVKREGKVFVFNDQVVVREMASMPDAVEIILPNNRIAWCPRQSLRSVNPLVVDLRWAMLVAFNSPLWGEERMAT